MTRLAVALLSLSIASFLGACAQQPARPAVGLTDVASRPAESALLAGIRAYDDGQYAQAEKHLDAALHAGLASPRDRATANKYLAFIYCTSNRSDQCESAFRTAIRADPAFVLTRSEAGHPMWGPVYRRVRP